MDHNTFSAPFAVGHFVNAAVPQPVLYNSYRDLLLVVYSRDFLETSGKIQIMMPQSGSLKGNKIEYFPSKLLKIRNMYLSGINLIVTKQVHRDQVHFICRV